MIHHLTFAENTPIQYTDTRLRNSEDVFMRKQGKMKAQRRGEADSESASPMNGIVDRLKREILPLLETVLTGSESLFQNPSLVNCRESTGCDQTGCTMPDNGSDPARCWHVEGTLCNGKVQGNFLQKYDDCRRCAVLQQSCPSVIEQIGEQINNIAFLMQEQKQKMLDDKHHIDRLHEQLSSLLEQLDLKSRQIQEVMITDNLTKLYNRHHLATVLEDEMARCQRYGHPLALMMIDIDQFRKFNNQFGQQEGDRMLAFTGSIIRENIRKFDRAFRYGGEEFVVVLPETDIMMAYIVAERVRNNFLKKSGDAISDNLSTEAASLTMSIGVTAIFTYSTSAVRIDELISQTESALNKAKANDGNLCVRYER